MSLEDTEEVKYKENHSDINTMKEKEFEDQEASPGTENTFGEGILKRYL
jgi:hypothetical protein